MLIQLNHPGKRWTLQILFVHYFILDTLDPYQKSRWSLCASVRWTNINFQFTCPLICITLYFYLVILRNIGELEPHRIKFCLPVPYTVRYIQYKYDDAVLQLSSNNQQKHLTSLSFLSLFAETLLSGQPLKPCLTMNGLGFEHTRLVGTGHPEKHEPRMSRCHWWIVTIKKNRILRSGHFICRKQLSQGPGVGKKKYVTSDASCQTNISHKTREERDVCHTCEKTVGEPPFIRVGMYKFHKGHFTCTVCDVSLHGARFKLQVGQLEGCSSNFGVAFDRFAQSQAVIHTYHVYGVHGMVYIEFRCELL